jgi:hypothetical protein
MFVTINDPGGDVLQHIAIGQSYAQSGAFLEVIYCVSACLLMIAQVPEDHVCIMRNAWIGYHSEHRRPDGTESPRTMAWERGRDWIVRGWRECGK